ncbi:hypothetical protein ACFL0V_06490 [Nanoarchaeota archaeon]
MDVITLSKVLKHYKRIQVQQKIADASYNKEAVGSYGGKGYAKRPDVIIYPADVFELVRQGITSFHISEETWSNPLNIITGMKKNDLNDLRIGWDLVLDIDCPYWEFAKIVTYLFVQALQDHKVKSISVKFSGNKGFHIGVPFEAFPESFNGVPTSTLFPDGPKKIAQYLLDHISRNLIKIDNDTITFGNKFPYTFDRIQVITKKTSDELLYSFCQSCNKSIKSENNRQFHFACHICGATFVSPDDIQYKKCMKCNVLMEKSLLDLTKRCCSSPDIVKTFNPLSIVEVDTVLIAPRHLYRAPYSYHEKSGLISVPIKTDHIIDFEKDEAKIENVKFDIPFMLRDADNNEGAKLLHEAWEFHSRIEKKKLDQEEFSYSKPKEFQDIESAIPEQFFPPCIQQILKGLEDGKKRALFVLINFLSSVGWTPDESEAFLKKWNENNPEALRDVYILGQLRHNKQHKKKALPPNCDNQAYYKDFHVCHPDNLCKYVKNPANYTIKKARYAQKQDHQAKRAEETKKPTETQNSAPSEPQTPVSETPKTSE